MPDGVRSPGTFGCARLLWGRALASSEISESGLLQNFQIGRVIDEGDDPLPVLVSEEVDAGGVLLNPPEVTVVEADEAAADDLVGHPPVSPTRTIVWSLCLTMRRLTAVMVRARTSSKPSPPGKQTL